MKQRVTVKDVLKRASRVLGNETKWTKGAHARDEDGFAVSPTCSSACSFCTLGAIRRAMGDLAVGYDLGNEANRRLQVEMCTFNVADWNDNPNTSFRDVKKAFRAAIARCK